MVALVTGVTGCSPDQLLGARATPSSSPGPAAGFNPLLGNNRVAAEASLKVGRALFAKQQIWEPNVRTEPATLNPDYDPANPVSFDGVAKQVTRADLVIATESAPAIRAYGAGGVEHEKAELVQLAEVLRSIFPSAQTIGVEVFYGENNPHARAIYREGRLDYQPIGP